MVIKPNQPAPASEETFLAENQLLTRPSKPRRSRASIKSHGFRQRLLIASGILTLGFKLVRLIEELLKMFKP